MNPVAPATGPLSNPWLETKSREKEGEDWRRKLEEGSKFFLVLNVLKKDPEGLLYRRIVRLKYVLWTVSTVSTPIVYSWRADYLYASNKR